MSSCSRQARALNATRNRSKISIRVFGLAFVLPALLWEHVHALSSPSGVSSPTSTSKSPSTIRREEGQIGIAFAGGSLRAASACTGILRGLQQKTITNSRGEDVPAMHAVKYNSGISGGSIPAVQYTYAQVPTDELLETDRTVDPSAITPEALATIPEQSMSYTLARKEDLPFRIIGFLSENSRLVFVLERLLKFHSWWSGFVYTKFARTLNIPRNKYFTSGPEELQTILKDNPALQETDFLLPRSDVKTLPMILWTMHGSRADANIYYKKFRKIMKEAWIEYQAEEALNYRTNNFDAGARPSMTKALLSVRDRGDNNGNLPPPFIGTPDAVYSPYHGTIVLRRSKVDFPLKAVKPFEWGTRSRFSLETLMALSTNFPGSSGSFIAQIMSNVRRVTFNDEYTGTQLFADGGTNDLMGILPLVQSGVDTIVASYIFNQNPPYTNFSESYADIYERAPSANRNDPDFDANFREWLKHMNPRFTCYFGFFGARPIHHANVPNHVFHDPNLDRLKELMVKYNSLFEAGEPLIATLHDLETIDNPFWGIEAGKKVDITLIYFNMPKTFSEQVPRECVPPPEGEVGTIDGHGRFLNDEMRVVPELPVDGPLDAFKYSREQINMMCYLGSWMVHHSWDGLQGLDGEIIFNGFGEIFEKGSKKTVG